MVALFSADPQVNMHPPRASISSARRFCAWCWAYRRLLSIGAGGGLLLGLCIALLKPVTYTSSATLIFPAAPISRLPMSTSGDLPSIPMLEGEMIVPQPGSSASTAALIMQSHHVSDEIIARFQLRRRWKLSTLHAARERFAQQLLCRIGKDGELEIGFQDRDPRRAFAIAQALQALLSDAIKDLGILSADKNLNVLQQEAADVAGDLQQARRQLQAFQEQSHLADASAQSRALTDQYTSVQTQLATARIEADAYDRQLGTMQSKARQLVEQSMDPTANTQAPATSPLASLYNQMKELDFALADLRSRFTEDYPDVQLKRNQLEIVRTQMQREIHRQALLVESNSSPLLLETAARLVDARAKAEGYVRLSAQLAQRVDQLPAQLSTFSRLSANVEMDIAAYKLYNEEIERARIIAASRGPVFTVVDPLVLPEDSDPTGRLMIISLLACFGLGLAALAPYARWRGEMAAGALATAGRTSDAAP